MQGAVNANYDDDFSVQPELDFVQPGATAVLAGESCSLGCEDAIAFRHLQAQCLEDHAGLWESRNIRREVGESILQAATEFRGDPVQLVLEVEGRQINVLVNLPPRGEESDPDDPRVVRIADWAGMSGNRMAQCADAWDHGDEEDDDEGR